MSGLGGSSCEWAPFHFTKLETQCMCRKSAGPSGASAWAPRHFHWPMGTCCAELALAAGCPGEGHWCWRLHSASAREACSGPASRVKPGGRQGWLWVCAPWAALHVAVWCALAGAWRDVPTHETGCESPGVGFCHLPGLWALHQDDLPGCRHHAQAVSACLLSVFLPLTSTAPRAPLAAGPAWASCLFCRPPLGGQSA